MLVHHKSVFYKGLALTIGFVVIFWYMFTPNFGGLNAFQASDNLFNSISKGSTYYIPQVREKAEPFAGTPFNVAIFDDKPEYAPYAATILEANGLAVTPGGKGLKVAGDLGTLMTGVINDSDAMFKNDGAALSSRYGMDERQAMYVWWQTMKAVKTALDQQKVFAPASFIDKYIVKRAIEVGYNYYGIEGQKAADRWGIILFSLVFYVVYTMWWGYAIFFLFHGFGLEMKAGKKKEM